MCTGIRLRAQDGSVVYGRSVEWGTFDLKSRVAVVPRGNSYTGLTPDGLNGKKWQGKYGFVGLDALGKDAYVDAMNEKGLAIGLFYHPGFAEYMKYTPDQAGNSITAFDVIPYILTQYETLDEVKRGMDAVRVVAVVEEALGIPAPAHWMVTEPSGKAIAIEILNGELRIFDNPLGVITNSPNYDWHMTNLRNYVNLSSVALPTKNIEDMDFAPLGGGSGMIGLPGDFTPVSRFVRITAWSQSARPTATSDETIYELFRILDNFNVPLGSAEGSDHGEDLEGMRSATIWTSGWELDRKILYYHTQHNRRLRKVDLGALDFSNADKGIVLLPLDKEKTQDVEDVTDKLK